MGSLNNTHQESGGVLLYSGELILLFCDLVNCEIKGHGNAKGKLYLTTHRVVFTATPIKPKAKVNSFSAPFYTMFDLSLDQPIFGANAIRGKVRGDPTFTFELRFNKGGAIEFGQALRNAARQASSLLGATNPHPYSTVPEAAAANYYQASEDIYQPNYPVGFVLPTQSFPDAPPPGFVYTSDVPPPYPGLVTQTTVTSAIPGLGVHPDPAALLFGLSSLTPAVYPTATTQYVISPLDPYTAAAVTSGAYPSQTAFTNGTTNPIGIDHPPTYDEAIKKKQ